MIRNRYYLIADVRTYWHSGTGRGGGSDFDALVERDRDGFPFLPGRHIKGLFRSAGQRLASWQTGNWSAERVELLFGRTNESRVSGVLEGRHLTVPGCLTFGSAHVPEKARDAFAARKILKAALFARLSSTAIDPSSGTALDKSLRSIEAAVPLVLAAEVSWDPTDTLAFANQKEKQAIEELSEDWAGQLRQCFGLIRSIGAHRSRGLGRVHFSLETAS